MSGDAARIVAQSAVLLATDFPASLAYWRDRVGFDVLSVFGDPPGFAILGHGAARLMLRRAPPGHVPRPFAAIVPGLWNAYFWVDDARALHAAMTAAGATVACPIEPTDYGVLEFALADPDGQTIGFGEVL